MHYIIYGAGRNAKKLIMALRSMIEIDYVIDADSEKQREKILGIEILPLTYLKSDKYMGQKVIISVSNKEFKTEIEEYLTQLGLKKDKDFIEGASFISIEEPIPGSVSGNIEGGKEVEEYKSFDPASRLIEVTGNNCIFRGVNTQYIEKYKKLVERCKSAALFGNYIISTEISTSQKNLPFELVLEHEYISPVSYCFEWSPKMFEDYVDFMLEFIGKLAQTDLGLSDGHTLNTTIWKGKFVFIDFGALKLEPTGKRTLIEFINTHLLPLLLFRVNQIEKAYMHLKNPGIEVNFADIKGYLTKEEKESVSKLYEMAMFIKNQDDIINFVNETKRFITGFREDRVITPWSGYQNDEWEWSVNKAKWSDKMNTVTRFLENTKPKTLVDLAGNMGWYGSYYHEKMKSAVIIDMDYSCIDYLWQRVKKDALKNVTPICMSVCAPTLDYYRDYEIGASGIIPWRKSAFKRFCSEMAIALAIVHHLAFSQQLNFEEIIAQFALFTSKYLIVEFIEQTDQYITDFIKTGFEWYTRDNFEQALKKKFEVLETGASTPCETRTIYLCRKKGGNIE